jgi:hypothetical protein
MKLTQPVLLQSFVDEFGVATDETCCSPAKQGSVQTKGDGKKALDQEEQTKYQSGVGKLRYLSSVREVSRQNEVTKSRTF